MRVAGHRTRMITQFAYLQAAAGQRDRHCYLWTLVNMLRLVCCMANEAGLETVLSAAYSLKHETDMTKTEHVQGVTMAKPMIFTDDTRQSHFAFANQVGVQTDEAAQAVAPVHDELSRTMKATCGWLTWRCRQASLRPCLLHPSRLENHILKVN